MPKAKRKAKRNPKSPRMSLCTSLSLACPSSSIVSRIQKKRRISGYERENETKLGEQWGQENQSYEHVWESETRV